MQGKRGTQRDTRHRPAAERNEDYRKRHNKRRHLKQDKGTLYLGLDGEGIGRSDHRYVYLAAVNEDMGRVWHVECETGLTTVQCLDFLLALPKNARVFGYALNYDLTMMLRDVDNEALYRLARPDLRQRKGEAAVKGPYPVHWNGYQLNMQGTKFSVRRGRESRVIWDVFKFFQSKFVNALIDWKVGEETLLARMAEMKDNRGNFDRLYKDDPESVRQYCREECAHMGQLARKLTNAHTDAGLDLRGKYYGAGSSASAMLRVMNIREQLKAQPPEMSDAVARAFFGGRFENSVVGPIRGMVYNYDISSAYPYQLTKLPCLIHGAWEHTTDRNRITAPGIATALVRYSLPKAPWVDSWGPFPYRMSKGSNEGSTESIGSSCFPIESAGGWVWREEYLAGERHFPNVQFEEAWIYHCACDCQPFADIPKYYIERLRIGKEGPGIVLKLGMNSCYGKLAQSVGNAMFNSWIWAGIITSGTRAQILDVLALHKDRSNMLMVATDGIYTRERLTMPTPWDTGTADAAGADGKRKPLGGWEETPIEKGVFVARPGIYFPMNPTKKELKKIRARGIGKAVVLESHAIIEESWNRYGITQDAYIKKVVRFCGMKSSISRTGKPGEYTYYRANGEGSKEGHDMPSYGQWVERPVKMSFNPRPKRENVAADGSTLVPRRMLSDVMSAPYKKVQESEEKRELEAVIQEILEQPNADLSEYE